jgi:hypothetical protein
MRLPEEVRLRVLTACVRFDRRTEDGLTVPRILENTSHYAVGLHDPTVDEEGRLVLHADAARAVGAIHVSSDESLTRLGVFGGGSGGSQAVVITLYQMTPDGPVQIRADSEDLFGAGNNLWVSVHQFERVH